MITFQACFKLFKHILCFILLLHTLSRYSSVEAGATFKVTHNDYEMIIKTHENSAVGKVLHRNTRELLSKATYTDEYHKNG